MKKTILILSLLMLMFADIVPAKTIVAPRNKIFVVRIAMMTPKGPMAENVPAIAIKETRRAYKVKDVRYGIYYIYPKKYIMSMRIMLDNVPRDIVIPAKKRLQKRLEI